MAHMHLLGFKTYERKQGTGFGRGSSSTETLALVNFQVNNCMTDLFCVTFTCQSPAVGCLGKLVALGAVAVYTVGGNCEEASGWQLVTDHTPKLFCVASSVMMGHLGSPLCTYHSFCFCITPLVCRGQAHRSDMYLADVRWLFLTLPIFRNNVLSEIPYQQICAQTGHSGSLLHA